MSAVSIFSIIDCWHSMFYDKHHLVYYNEQQIYLATLWSAFIIQYINWLGIIQFVVRMRSNKNHKIRHSRKKFCGLEGFSLNPWIFKISTHNGFCFYLSTELAKFPGNLINLGWFSHVLGTIYSNPMYNFSNNSIPCTQ